MSIFHGHGRDFIKASASKMLGFCPHYYAKTNKATTLAVIRYLQDVVRELKGECEVSIEAEIPKIKYKDYHRVDAIVRVDDGGTNRLFLFEFKKLKDLQDDPGEVVRQIAEYREILRDVKLFKNHGAFKDGGNYLHNTFLIVPGSDRKEVIKLLASVKYYNESISVFGDEVDFVSNRMQPKKRRKGYIKTHTASLKQLLPSIR